MKGKKIELGVLSKSLIEGNKKRKEKSLRPFLFFLFFKRIVPAVVQSTGLSC